MLLAVIPTKVPMGNANNNRIEVKIKNIRKNLQFVFAQKPRMNNIIPGIIKRFAQKLSKKT